MKVVRSILILLIISLSMTVHTLPAEERWACPSRSRELMYSVYNISILLPVADTIPSASYRFEFTDADTKIVEYISIDDFDAGEPPYPPSYMDLGPDEDPLYFTADEMPTFMGGDILSFRRWVLENYEYPKQALEKGIQGRITLQFIVEKDGLISNVSVLSTADRLLSNQAVKVVSSSPQWSPAKVSGEPVRFKITLPMDICIKIDEGCRNNR